MAIQSATDPGAGPHKSVGGRRPSEAVALGAAPTGVDVRDRLQKVDQLQQAGKTDDAVHEMLSVAALYASRSVPVKAVAVLRQAVRLKPDSPDVRMAYGEVLQQLRMVEDAAREYGLACAQLEAAGRYSEWLEVLRRLLAMDADNLQGRLQLAEALSRAGKTQEAIDAFRSLAELLLERGETEDWEKVAERLLFHDPSDNTAAHDLALHYVRSGRHAEALSKLILCYEAVPNDAELLELIVETLESLGQREKAAVICRELVRTFRRTGLQQEADRALEQLYSLDPDDPEAREFMGVLHGELASDTVIELEAGAVSPATRLSGVQRQRVSGGHSPLPVVPPAAVQPLSGQTQSAQTLPGPTRPSQPRPAAQVPARATPAADDLDSHTMPLAQPRTPSRATLPFDGRGQPAPPQPAQPAPAARPAAAAQPASRPSAPAQVVRSETGRHPAAQPIPMPAAPRMTGRHPVAPAGVQPLGHAAEVARATLPAGAAPPVAPAARPSGPVPVPRPLAPPAPQAAAPQPSAPHPSAHQPSGHQPSVPQPFAQGPAASAWDAPTDRGPYGPGRAAAPMPALDALASTLDAAAADRSHDDDHWADDDEAGFDVEERTMVDEGEELARLLKPGLPDLVMPLGGTLPDADPTDASPVASARRRSNSLPRPRLARRPGTSTELPTALRDMSKDLSTLDFFIERGFHESAVALLEALQKRHPDFADLQLYRDRIDRMHRG